jgi:hypothetical protein
MTNINYLQLTLNKFDNTYKWYYQVIKDNRYE